MSQEYKLKNIKISNGRFLEFDSENLPIKSPLILPFGSIYKDDEHELFYQNQGSSSRLLAKALSHGENTAQILLPTYSTTVQINHERLEKELKLDFWVIERDVERIEAQGIILRSHYLDIPKHGLYLGCRFTDPDEQEDVLNMEICKEERPDKWSAAWTEKPGRIIGCAVLSTLLHGKPKGRREVAERLQQADVIHNWDTLTRSEIIDKLRIAWISRIAIDAPYRGFGLGTHLVKQLSHIAINYRVPKASAIEVMRTVPSKEAELLMNGQSDFLTRGGYTLFHKKSSSQPLLTTDKENGNRIKPSVNAKKLYYYNILQ
jgi:GNAT superfamily N-acetyltransferase